MKALVVLVAVVAGAPGALAAVHLTALSLAAPFYSSTRPHNADRWRLLVLIPARNEESVIGRAVASVARQQRDGDSLVVVADRCSDATAARAVDAGAEVLERPMNAAPGKSASLHDGLDHMRERAWDALVTLDADSVVGDGFVAACERSLRAGALAAQARSEALPGPGLLRQASVIATALQGVTLPRGRDRLGVSARLKGPGMIVRRDVLTRHPLPFAASSEDSRYGLELVEAGIVARHVDEARVRSESPRRLATLSGQRVRWEMGRVLLARQHVGPLLRMHTAASLEAALHLVTPPLAVAVLLLGVSGVLAALGGAWILVWAAVLLVGMILLDVVMALLAARANARAWMALVLAPAYVVWKGFVQVRAVLAARTPARPFEPTARD